MDVGDFLVGYSAVVLLVGMGWIVKKGGVVGKRWCGVKKEGRWVTCT